MHDKIKDLKRYKFAGLKKQLAEKVAKGELTQQEMDQLTAVERACWDAVQVDEFSFEAMKGQFFSSLAETFANPLDEMDRN